jgi:formylglycine-generating enzyme required for sulfatase activity
VPRGLRSFDAGDADFFLELLPGPRDRDGLPESIRFWKGRIEGAGAEGAFCVGLIYGPSGCGKSSLVKAGLLPRLSPHVVPVYVEATAPGETTARLLAGLRRRCPDLLAEASLAEALAALRRGGRLPPGGKVLLVLDQFEQFLHANRDRPDTGLARALRQCDGVGVQALVLVRDDFWLAVTRFLAELEIDLVPGHNVAAVDLFDADHARKVLAALGRGYGRLAPDEAAWSAEEKAFLDRVVADLARDGWVVPVQLALFAEMVKSRPWSLATLKAVGGTEGVGVAFLEESFASPSASPQHRVHQKAVRGVLRALLPEPGTDLKGHRRSRSELEAASGYAGASRDFADLLRILDSELRLVTPADPEELARRASEGDPPARSVSEGHYYQLTHDYLVSSLREWLTRKQKETRRGRAELRLAERAAAWNAKPENRHLPAWWEWLNIRLLTRPRDWTPMQARMMRRAAHFHAVRGAAVAAGLAVVVLTGLAAWGKVREQQRQDRAEAVVKQLLVADTAQVPGIVAGMDDYRPLAGPLLRQALARAAPDSKDRLHLGLALLPEDAGQADYLYGRLLRAGPDELPVLRDALLDDAAVRQRLWDLLPDGGADPAQRFRAACTLAGPDAMNDFSERCKGVEAFVASRLLTAVRQNPASYLAWVGMLRPVRDWLTGPLGEVFRNRERPEEARLAASILGDYLADRPEALAELLCDASPEQGALLFPLLAAHRERAVALLEAELGQTASFDWKDAPLERAWAAVDPALVRRVEAAGGMVAERFAFCQTLPLEQFDAVAEGLGRSGYRPVRLRPYEMSGPESRPPLIVAAVWVRDGGGWQAVHGLTAREVRRQDAERRRQGFQPVDVAGYRSGGQERYAALWVQDGRDDEARLYAGVPGGRHEADGWGPLAAARLGPVTLHVLTGADGKPRYSSVWQKITPPMRWHWGDDEATHADRGLSDGFPVDVALSASTAYIDNARAELLGWLSGSPWAGLALRSQHPLVAHPERRYAGCFRAGPRFGYAVAFGLTPQEQVRRCRELAGEGYRPAALSVAAFPPPAARLVTASVWHRPLVPEEVRERLARRQANAAAALLRLGRAECLWPLLVHRHDPRLRSYLIDRLAPLGADPQALIRRLDEEPDVSARRALVLCLGEFGREQLPPARREALAPALLRLYREAADPGLHAAAEWLLRQWQQGGRLAEIDRELARRDRDAALHGHLPPEGRRWYVNGQGQTMAVIAGGEFVMGSPRFEVGRYRGPHGTWEMQHRRRIDRTFALSTKEVTLRQFRGFLAHHDVLKTFSPSPEYPVNRMSWFQAAAYCNWLSRQEGIPEDQWCYLPNEDGEYAAGMRVRPNFLSLSGYRLPTEAEWEFACRAGAVTRRCYGQSDDLLAKYAWYAENSHDRQMLQPGNLKPNDLGLFDLYGNASEWCQDAQADYVPGTGGGPARDVEDAEDVEGITDDEARIVRGGSLNYRAWDLRSAHRSGFAPGSIIDACGIRPARTVHRSQAR